MTITVSVLDDFAQLARRAPALAAATRVHDLFTSFGWFRNLYETALVSERRLRLYLVESTTGSALACLPLSTDATAGRFPRVRRLMSLSNFYSSLFGPIVPDEATLSAAMCRSFAKTIKASKPSYDVVDLRPLDVAAPFPALMRDALSEQGFLVHEYFCFGNWYLPTHGVSFADYLASRPSPLRNTLSRKERALQNIPGVTIVVEHEPGADLERAISDFCRVYLRSWKKPEPFPDFVPGLCRFLARERWLRVGVIRVGQEPIAAQIFVVVGGRALIYKMAYDDKHAKLSPGSVLTKRLFEHVMTVDRVTEIDYLTGDESYKHDWMSARRERHGLIAFNRSTLLGLTLAVRHRAGRFGRVVLRHRDPSQSRSSAQIPRRRQAD